MSRYYECSKASSRLKKWQTIEIKRGNMSWLAESLNHKIKKCDFPEGPTDLLMHALKKRVWANSSSRFGVHISVTKIVVCKIPGMVCKIPGNVCNYFCIHPLPPLKSAWWTPAIVTTLCWPHNKSNPYTFDQTLRVCTCMRVPASEIQGPESSDPVASK